MRDAAVQPQIIGGMGLERPAGRFQAFAYSAGNLSAKMICAPHKPIKYNVILIITKFDIAYSLPSRIS